jgi:hypothetical protein
MHMRPFENHCMSSLSAAAFAFAALVITSPPAAAAAPQSAALKGPYVTAVSDRDATVRFELATSAPAAIEVTSIASAASMLRRIESPASAMHRVHVTGLQPATRYAFVVRAGGVVVGEGHVVTAPKPDSGAPITFLVYGDNRTDDAAHASVVRAMVSVPSDFIVNTGDMVQDGASTANWQTFFDIEKPLLAGRALLSAIGNHELYDDASGTNFARYFGFVDDGGVEHPYGTVRFGSARFFFLNAMDDWATGPERAWLESELARADTEPGLVWRFAVVHQGPWSAGPHGPNAKLLEAGVPQLLAAHKVDLLLAGHDHLYERGDGGGLKYIVSGGGGAPLYRDLHETPTTRKVEPAHHFLQVSLDGHALKMVATRDDGSVLDTCGFTQGGPWDCDAPRKAPAPSAAPAPTVSASPSPSSHGCTSGEPAAAARAGGAAPTGAPFAVFAVLLAAALVRSRRRG